MKNQTLMLFGVANGIVSAGDAIGLADGAKKYQYEALQELFSARFSTFMQEDISFDRMIRKFPEFEVVNDIYDALKLQIDNAYSGDPYAAGQVFGMCLAAGLGELKGADISALRSLGKNGTKAVEFLENLKGKTESPKLGGGTVKFSEKVSAQKQARHLDGTRGFNKGYLNSLQDAQNVLDDYNSGNYVLISENPSQNSVTIEVKNVTGTYVNEGNPNGLPDISFPTNTFTIQSSGSPKVIPVNPNKPVKK